MDIPVLSQGKDLRQKIVEHMGKDPANLSIVSEQFERYQHANVHLALEEYINGSGRRAQVLGAQSGGIMAFAGTSLADIVSPKTMVSMVGLSGVKEGPVQYKTISADNGKKISCVQGGLYLIKDSLPITVLMRQQTMDFTGSSGIVIEVLADTRSIGEDFMNALRKSINKNNIYRGKILAVSTSATFGATTGTNISFHSLPKVTREQIILPEGLLKRIERQTIEASKYSASLLKAGRKLKRGILLHGKPGTGKTLTAMYLASVMPDRTVLICTGNAQGLVEFACQIARWLAPAMVVIEDVDLIGQDRATQNSCQNALLLELMNQMDGLEDDCDVLFFLTTNRPEILEPALANRPGRIDQAYEVPLPDAECRRRLFELYSKGLNMNVPNMDVFIKRTEGASGAFIAELLRKAALFAAPEGDPITVTDKHLDEALHELVIAGGALTKRLLGFSASTGFGSEKQ